MPTNRAILAGRMTQLKVLAVTQNRPQKNTPNSTATAPSKEKDMEDFRQDGFNDGYGQGYFNSGHEAPESDGDRYDYRVGREDGERRRRISEELEE